MKHLLIPYCFSSVDHYLFQPNGYLWGLCLWKKCWRVLWDEVVRRDSNILFNGNVTEISPSLHLAQGTERVGCGTTGTCALPTCPQSAYSEESVKYFFLLTLSESFSFLLNNDAGCWDRREFFIFFSPRLWYTWIAQGRRSRCDSSFHTAYPCGHLLVMQSKWAFQHPFFLKCWTEWLPHADRASNKFLCGSDSL